MILMSTSEHVTGKYTATDLRDQSNRLLLKKGALLTDSHVQLLQALKVQSIYVEMEGTEDICPEDVVAPELRVECQAALSRSLEGLTHQANIRQIAVDSQAIQKLMHGLVEDLFSSADNLITLMNIQDWDNRLFQHSVNTAVLGTLLAKSMGFSEKECKSLAMGMIFHDAGQMFLPREIFEKPGPLTPAELTVAHEHARVGYKRMFHNTVMSSMASYIILRHHERMDGTGYPDGLRGDQIHPLARIASVVEAYDSMTSLRPYRRTLMPDEALCEILRQSGKAYDPKVVLALSQHIAVYPIGSAVELTTGETGIVVSTRKGSTTRPKVRLFYAPDGSKMQRKDVDLSRDITRQIARSRMSLEQLKPNNRQPMLQAA